MQLQTDLEGNHLGTDPQKPWTGICSEQCWMAEGKRCRCSCGGAFHGIGIGYTKGKEKHPFGTPVTFEQAQPFIEQMKRTKCRCGESLRGEIIYGYPHPGGWTVQGLSEKQWLFIKCPKCGNKRSLWKLGVPRQ